MNYEVILSIIEDAQSSGASVLNLSEEDIMHLPDEMGNLVDLKELYLTKNHLTDLPNTIGRPQNLEALDVSGNYLTDLPTEIGRLGKLTNLIVDEDQLAFPPPEIVRQGTRAIVDFFRAQLEESRPQWVSKLLLVGEGGCWKDITCTTFAE